MNQWESKRGLNFVNNPQQEDKNVTKKRHNIQARLASPRAKKETKMEHIFFILLLHRIR